MMNEFRHFHPVVNFLYFAAVITFSMLLMHPICLAVSLVCGFAYKTVQSGSRGLRFCAAQLLIIAAAALFNPLFSHEGSTVLAYFPSGNPLTAESVVYGIAAGTMLASVICWFSCFNSVMTSDKLLYLFGRVIPSLSLVLSMVLRFVPKFREHLLETAAARKCIGRGTDSGGLITRARHGVTILSGMTTWALENSIETADSMKSRGYGLSGRSTFSIFKADRRDLAAALLTVALSIYIIAEYVTGGIFFAYFPTVGGAPLSPRTAGTFCAYFALCALPVIFELWEDRKWKSLKQKI